MLHITPENFQSEVLESKTPVIIDFFADWCMPCQMMAPVFEKLSKEFEGKLKFAKIDTQTHPEFATQFSIRGIPALVVTKNGKEINRIVGFMPEEELKAKIESALKEA